MSGTYGGQKRERASFFILELQMVVSSHIGTQNKTQVQSSQLLTHFPNSEQFWANNLIPFH